ncbi:MAG TPA: (2Fe-2S)-binding protein [bacterium]|nr:(2Fe-2S)-binding protein [bacterium]
MNRRRFVQFSGCMLAAGMLTRGRAWAASESKAYPALPLFRRQGQPLQAKDLEPKVTYIFFYPYVGTPVFLIDLGMAVGPVRIKDGESERVWPGGVGPRRSIVAFSAICHHQLTRPSPAESLINYSPIAGDISQVPDRITCCTHDTVYDPAAGARVVDGPAESALTTILLQHDPAQDTLRAVGTAGVEVFQEFFRQYRVELLQEFGPGRAREEQNGPVPVLRLSEYSQGPITC